VDADVEAKAKAIADQAKSQRKRLPRSAWSASLIIALVCVAALVIGYLVKPAAPDEGPPVHLGNGAISVPSHETIHGVFGVEFFIGVVAGIGIGVTIGRRLAARDDQPIKSSHS
jgi:uncharacterized membrane protein